MSLAPTIIEKLARARGDLRMGVPIVLAGGGTSAVLIAVEELDTTRLADLRALGRPELALTLRRAETLKARAYDGDLARIEVPADVGLDWLHALADPKDDLRMPMKGPLHSLRDGTADLHRAGLALAKTSRLLPAVLLVKVPDGFSLALREGLSFLTLAEIEQEQLLPSHLHPVSAARVPLAVQAPRITHQRFPKEFPELAMPRFEEYSDVLYRYARENWAKSGGHT